MPFSPFIDFEKVNYKDFEFIPNLNVFERAEMFDDFRKYKLKYGPWTSPVISQTGCGPEVLISTPFHQDAQKCISLVSNDYLNYTQHPKVKAAAIAAIEQHGTATCASASAGGYQEYHRLLEHKLSAFFHRPADSSLVYTSAYSAISSTLLTLLKAEDCAIIDAAVHPSVYDGLYGTQIKSFPHNHMVKLEKALIESQHKYLTRLVIIDGVYAINGDLARMKEIYELTKKYGAFLMVNDAHGIGVLGKTGRGTTEDFNLLTKVDLISGTLGKAFGNQGGFMIASPEIAHYLKFQSRQQQFSSTLGPACAAAMVAIDLIDEEPVWRIKLADNISYYRKGLHELKLHSGKANSAIIPIKVGDAKLTYAAASLLLEAGIYANPVVYPDTALTEGRIRTNLMASHTREQIDKVLNAFDDVFKKLKIERK